MPARSGVSPLEPAPLLAAYGAGIFPMAQARDSDEILWFSPQDRGVFLPGGFHVSRSLARRIRKGGYRVTLNGDFAAVLRACADRTGNVGSTEGNGGTGRADTWINDAIAAAYLRLHRLGHAHSVEVWQAGRLAGGIYGVTLGAAFFGESMFSAQRDGSKLALAHLTRHLDRSGFALFDTQFLTPHLHSLGAVEIPRPAYLRRLRAATAQVADITARPLPARHEVWQRSTQIS